MADSCTCMIFSHFQEGASAMVHVPPCLPKWWQSPSSNEAFIRVKTASRQKFTAQNPWYFAWLRLKWSMHSFREQNREILPKEWTRQNKGKWSILHQFVSLNWSMAWFRQGFFPQGNATWANVYFKTPVAVGRPCWISCHRCFGVICHINSYKCTMCAMQYQQKRHIPLLPSVWNTCRYTTAARFVNSRIFELQNFFAIVKQVELTKVCSCSTKEVVSGGDVGGSNFIR